MVLKVVFPVVLGAALIVGGAASASDYRPDEFLGLDLSKAVLSPTPLGPPSTFAPVPVEAKGDTSGTLAQGDTRKIATERVTAPSRNQVATARRDSRVARAESEKPRGASRVKLAHRHGNPLNAEAMDTRIQKWPCNPDMGGICAWRH